MNIRWHSQAHNKPQETALGCEMIFLFFFLHMAAQGRLLKVKLGFVLPKK